MKVTIASGEITINKRSASGKWLQGWMAGNGWTGLYTLAKAWEYCADRKPSGCSWYAYGLLCAREQQHGRDLAAREEA